jgi:hypothetical protein
VDNAGRSCWGGRGFGLLAGVHPRDTPRLERTGSLGGTRALSTSGAAAAAGAGASTSTPSNNGLNAIKVDNAGRACRVGVQIGRGTGLLAGLHPRDAPLAGPQTASNVQFGLKGVLSRSH